MTKNQKKALDFMIENPQIDYLAKDVQHKAKISKAGANLALKSLVEQGLIEKEEKGKVFIYSVSFSNPRIKERKRLNNVEKITPLVKKLESHSVAVVLFGSAGRGENFSDSDFDLYILTSSPRTAREIIDNYDNQERLQAIIQTPLDAVHFNKENPVLSKEIAEGIVLWKQP